MHQNRCFRANERADKHTNKVHAYLLCFITDNNCIVSDSEIIAFKFNNLLKLEVY